MINQFNYFIANKVKQQKKLNKTTATEQTNNINELIIMKFFYLQTQFNFTRNNCF
jgi:hypothetical protein